MLICEARSMRNFVFIGNYDILYEKQHKKFVFELNFHNFQKKKKLMLIRLLATTLSPLGLMFFDFVLALLAIQFFLLSHASSYLMTL
jgi:hypothetical protein